jgi:hypothetical protein
MSFSGYSMATSPGEIQEEYPTFRKIHLPLLIISVILMLSGIVLL